MPTRLARTVLLLALVVVMPAACAQSSAAPTQIEQSGVTAVGIGAVPVVELERLSHEEAAALEQASVLLGVRGNAPVLLVPDSGARLEGLLARAPGALAGTAAVTMGPGTPLPAGATEPAGTRARLWLNREVLAGLPEQGRAITLRHESAHALLGSADTAGVPLWLAEGVAEWVGYQGSGVPLAVAANPLTRAVQAGRAPVGLPVQTDFDGGERGRLAYAQSLVAVQWLVDRIGPTRLVALVRACAAGTGTTPEANADAALAEVGLRRADLVRGWRSLVT